MSHPHFDQAMQTIGQLYKYSIASMQAIDKRLSFNVEPLGLRVYLRSLRNYLIVSMNEQVTVVIAAGCLDIFFG